MKKNTRIIVSALAILLIVFLISSDITGMGIFDTINAWRAKRKARTEPAIEKAADTTTAKYADTNGYYKPDTNGYIEGEQISDCIYREEALRVCTITQGSCTQSCTETFENCGRYIDENEICGPGCFRGCMSGYEYNRCAPECKDIRNYAEKTGCCQECCSKPDKGVGAIGHCMDVCRLTCGYIAEAGGADCSGACAGMCGVVQSEACEIDPKIYDLCEITKDSCKQYCTESYDVCTDYINELDRCPRTYGVVYSSCMDQCCLALAGSGPGCATDNGRKICEAACNVVS